MIWPVRVTYQHFSQQVQINTVDVNLTLCAPGHKLPMLSHHWWILSQACWSNRLPSPFQPTKPSTVPGARCFLPCREWRHNWPLCSLCWRHLPIALWGPFQGWIRPMGILAKSQRSVTFLVIPPTHTHIHIQGALFFFCVSYKLWQ